MNSTSAATNAGGEMTILERVYQYHMNTLATLNAQEIHAKRRVPETRRPRVLSIGIAPHTASGNRPPDLKNVIKANQRSVMHQ